MISEQALKNEKGINVYGLSLSTAYKLQECLVTFGVDWRGLEV